jgi:hypothetical protein
VRVHRRRAVRPHSLGSQRARRAFFTSVAWGRRLPSRPASGGPRGNGCKVALSSAGCGLPLRNSRAPSRRHSTGRRSLNGTPRSGSRVGSFRIRSAGSAGSAAPLDPRAGAAVGNAVFNATGVRVRDFPCAAGAWHGRGLVCYARSSEGMGESGGRKWAYQSYGLEQLGDGTVHSRSTEPRGRSGRQIARAELSCLGDPRAQSGPHRSEDGAGAQRVRSYPFLIDLEHRSRL